MTEDGGRQLWKFKRYHLSERIAVLHVLRAEKLWGCLPASNFFCLRSAHIENINRESRFYFQKHSPGDARSTEREPLTKPSPLLTERGDLLKDQPDVSTHGASSCCFFQEQWKELSHEDLEPPPEHVPPPPRPPKRIVEPYNGKCKEFFSNHQWVKDESEEDKEDDPIKEETITPLSVPCIER